MPARTDEGRLTHRNHAQEGSMDLMNDVRRLASIGTFFIYVGWFFVIYTVIAGVIWWVDLAQRPAFNLLEAFAVSAERDRRPDLPGLRRRRVRLRAAAVRSVHRQQVRLTCGSGGSRSCSSWPSASSRARRVAVRAVSSKARPGCCARTPMAGPSRSCRKRSTPTPTSVDFAWTASPAATTTTGSPAPVAGPC